MHPLRVVAGVIWVVGLLLAPSLAHAQDVPAKPSAIVQFRLANGLDVILEEDDRQPSVAVMVGYDVGRRDDPPGLAGLAHLVEHLSFRGSRHLPRAYAGTNLLQRAGATSINGATASDFTYYQEVVPSDALPLALFVESERMAFSLERFTTQSIRLEQDIIWREGQLRAASAAAAFARDELNAFFGEGHPYFQAEHADAELDHARLAAVRAFFQQTYRPDNAHLILVGDFELAPTRALIEQYFAPIVAPRQPLRRAGPTPRSAPARSFVRRDYADCDQLSATWAAPAAQSDLGVASLLFATQLRRNVAAALYRDSLASTNVTVAVDPLDLGSLLSLRISVDGDIDLASRTFARELRGIWATDWVKQLPRLRSELMLARQLARESLPEVAMAHLISTRTSHRPYDERAFAAQVNQITPAQMRALREWFSGKQAMIGWLLHVNDEPGRRFATGLEVVPR